MQDYNSPSNNSKKVWYIPSSLPKQKSKINFWLLISIIIIALGIVIIIFLLSGRLPETISNLELSSGTTLELKSGDRVQFSINDVRHTLRVASVSLNYVDLVIQSEPFSLRLNVDEEKKLDLNGDGMYDLRIKLVGIYGDISAIYIRRISEPLCTENWQCQEWGPCSENGTQTRICTDTNNCGTTINKPITTQDCVYASCTENWNCTEWGECLENGTQTRICTDTNNCGTTINKPDEERNCNSTEFLDCGTSILNFVGNGDPNLGLPPLQCFGEAFKDCEPTRLKSKVSFEIFGMVVETNSDLELGGIEFNKCIYSSSVINQTITFSEELIQSMLDQGLSFTEIEELIESANNQSKIIWGTENLCNFNLEDLLDLSDLFLEGVFMGSTCELIEEEWACYCNEEEWDYCEYCETNMPNN